MVSLAIDLAQTLVLEELEEHLLVGERGHVQDLVAVLLYLVPLLFHHEVQAEGIVLPQQPVP